MKNTAKKTIETITVNGKDSLPVIKQEPVVTINSKAKRGHKLKDENVNTGKELIKKALQANDTPVDDLFFLLKLNLFQQNLEYIHDNIGPNNPLAIKMCKAITFALQYWMNDHNIGYSEMNKAEEDLFQFLLDRENELIMKIDTEEAA